VAGLPDSTFDFVARIRALLCHAATPAERHGVTQLSHRVMQFCRHVPRQWLHPVCEHTLTHTLAELPAEGPKGPVGARALWEGGALYDNYTTTIRQLYDNLYDNYTTIYYLWAGKEFSVNE